MEKTKMYNSNGNGLTIRFPAEMAQKMIADGITPKQEVYLAYDHEKKRILIYSDLEGYVRDDMNNL